MKMVIPGILTFSNWRSEVEPSWRLEPFSKEQFSGQMTPGSNAPASAKRRDKNSHWPAAGFSEGKRSPAEVRNQSNNIQFAIIWRYSFGCSCMAWVVSPQTLSPAEARIRLTGSKIHIRGDLPAIGEALRIPEGFADRQPVSRKTIAAECKNGRRVECAS
jgi:hypothetical protein